MAVDHALHKAKVEAYAKSSGHDVVYHDVDDIADDDADGDHH